jgi:hypothetical protein
MILGLSVSRKMATRRLQRKVWVLGVGGFFFDNHFYRGAKKWSRMGSFTFVFAASNVGDGK